MAKFRRTLKRYTDKFKAAMAAGLSDTGIKNPANSESVAYAGSMLTWNQIQNAMALDAYYAIVSTGSGWSNYLHPYNYNLNVPTGKTIAKLEVIARKLGQSGASHQDKSVRLFYNGSVMGAERAIAGAWAATPFTTIYEFPGDGLTPEILNHSTFGPVFSAQQGACFIAGTKVSTPYGDVNIEDIQEGDIVYGFDTESLEVVWIQVLHKRMDIAQNVYKITAGENECQATEDHPFFTENGWVKVKDLVVGQKVFIKDGGSVVERTIDSIFILAGTFNVYDLDVTDGNDTFIANGFAVHNKPQGAQIDILQLKAYWNP